MSNHLCLTNVSCRLNLTSYGKQESLQRKTAGVSIVPGLVLPMVSLTKAVLPPLVPNFSCSILELGWYRSIISYQLTSGYNKSFMARPQGMQLINWFLSPATLQLILHPLELILFYLKKALSWCFYV